VSSTRLSAIRQPRRALSLPFSLALFVASPSYLQLDQTDAPLLHGALASLLQIAAVISSRSSRSPRTTELLASKPGLPRKRAGWANVSCLSCSLLHLHSAMAPRLSPQQNPFEHPLNSSASSSPPASSSKANPAPSHLRQRSLTSRIDSLPRQQHQQQDLGHSMALNMGAPGAFVSSELLSSEREGGANLDVVAHATGRRRFLEGFFTLRRLRCCLVQLAPPLRCSRLFAFSHRRREQVRALPGRRSVLETRRPRWRSIRCGG